MRQPPICCREIGAKKRGGTKRFLVYYLNCDRPHWRLTTDRCDRPWIEEELTRKKPWSEIERSLMLERKLNGDTAFASALGPMKEKMDAHKRQIVSSAMVATGCMCVAAAIGWFTFIHAVDANQAPPQASIKRSVK